MSWYVEDGRLTHDDLPAVLPRYVPPYPSGVWYVQNGKLTHSALPEVLPIYIPPLAPGIWYVENDMLTNSLMPETIIKGAFCNCSELRTAVIPSTVTYIGPYAFYGTALRKVTLPRNCTYFSTSFPRGCIVETTE